MKRISLVGALACVVAVGVAPGARAHEDRRVGAVNVVVGWAEEPTIVGFKNGAQIVVRDSGGNPIRDARLKVRITAGGKTSEPLTLQESSPGDYRAATIPTVAGRYVFRFAGTIGSTKFDQSFTSGPTTFESPRNARELEFPDQPPTRAELAALVRRTGTRVAGRADSAASKATLGLTLGAAGVLLGLASLVIALRKREG